MLATLSDDVFHGRLKEERAVGSIERLAVPEVDLVLARAEFVVAGKSTDVQAVEHAHEVQEVAVGVDERAGHVDAAGLAQRAGEHAVLIAVRNVELELGADHGVQAELLVRLDYLLQYRPRRHHVRLAVGIEGVTDDVRNAGFPTERRNRAGENLREEVLKTIARNTVGLVELATGRRRPHALTECGPVVGGLVELADQDVLRTRNAQNIREHHAQDINAALAEVVPQLRQVVNHCYSFVASLVGAHYR